MLDTKVSSSELQRIYVLRFDEMRAHRTAVWSVLTRDYFQNVVAHADLVAKPKTRRRET